MKNDTQWLLLGSLLLVGLASCRHDQPPAISIICIGDGVGGANCVADTGVRSYKKPSELVNFWMTTQEDQKNYSSWCYKTTPTNIAPAMAQIKEQIEGGENGTN